MLQPVLFVAHHFPPMGGPGVHRSLNFVKHLPDSGYLPYVLTIALEDIRKGAYPADESLLSEIPKEVNIIRISNGEPRRLKKILAKIKLFRLFWIILYPLFWEPSALWPFKAYSLSLNLIKKKNIKLIYTTSGPFSSLLLGFMLKQKTKVKWVADLRDPYTDAYAWLFPTKLHWRFSRIIERFIIRKADVLIVNTAEVKKLYLKRKLMPEYKIKVLTNGF